VSANRTTIRPQPLALIVENHEDTREMYAEALVFGGLRVVESTNATDALEQARRLGPDVIATDIGLPGTMDGCELTRALKNDARTTNIPVIAVTAWAMGDHAARARQAGCDSVLLKPVLPKELLAEIQRLLKLAETVSTR
jgi:CheY-like chemotaxis protein